MPWQVRQADSLHAQEPPPIFLSRLSLSGFRNHTQTRLELAPGLSVFQGPNGHGKSNLLEAAYMLAIAKSPRATNDRELINWDLLKRGGHLQVLGVGREADVTVQTQVDIDVGLPGAGAAAATPSTRKSFRVNGIVRSASDFVGNLNIVFFEAGDLEIVFGSPSVRRRYLDILISQSHPQYLKNFQRYSRVVTQRNRLLRMVRDGNAGRDELVFWDERLAYEGAQIVLARQRAVEGLVEHAAPTHSNLTDGNSLTLRYRPRLTPSSDDMTAAEDLTGADIEARIAESLQATRQRETAQAVTVIGPHRDELDIMLGGRSAGSFASRGEARTIALALKMAEASFVSAATGRTPVLALDDLLSELDERRRGLVLDSVAQYEQVLLTTTDFSVVPEAHLRRAETFSVRSGEVQHSAAPV